MSYQGVTGYRPPLPPRSPRSSFDALSIPEYSHFPPPPSTSSSAFLSSHNVPGSGPPLPPRPVGFQHSDSRPSDQGGSSQSSTPFLSAPNKDRPEYSSFPPPPASPNRQQTLNGQRPAPPLPPRPQLQVSPTYAHHTTVSHTPSPPAPSLTPSALSPNQLTSFPPPPPGPPPVRISPLPGWYHGVSQQQQFMASSVTPVTSTVTLPVQETSGFRSKFPLPPDPPDDPEIPNSPPPAYTPVALPGSRVPPERIHTQYETRPTSSSPLGNSSGPVQEESLITSPYTRFPTATFARTTTPSPRPSPAIPSPATSVQAPFSVPSPALVTQSVSDAQSPNELSFFPAPPFPTTPMSQSDPIDELMLSMDLGNTVSEISPDHNQDEGLYSAVSQPEGASRLAPGLGDMNVAPLRPPKSLLGNGIAISQSLGECSQHTGSSEGRCSPATLGGRSSTEYSQRDNLVDVKGHGGSWHNEIDGGKLGGLTRKPMSVSEFNAPTPSNDYSGTEPQSVVTSCIDTPMTFVTRWYSHTAAPEFVICSRCYTENIAATKFANAFRSSVRTDGKARLCRFSKPRMKDHIFPKAVSTSYLQPLIDYMRRRSSIADCRGVDGINGLTASGANIKWYVATDGSIPGFVTCEACYEDHAACNPLLLSNFQELARPQGPQEVWACDFALPFIQKQYTLDGKNTDNIRSAWNNFGSEAKSRISIPRCANAQPVRSYGKKWFQPVSGPASLIFCASCYCDQVIHTGEESKWCIVPGLAEARDMQVRCSMGGRFNIRIAMARAHEVNDFSLFWEVIDKLEKQPMCKDEGVRNGEWWTLIQQPREFQVCGACYVAICEPLAIQKMFARKSDPISEPTELLHCCFNIAHLRLKNYLPRLLEMYLTRDPTALVKYAEVYATIPPCGRDYERRYTQWYG